MSCSPYGLGLTYDPSHEIVSRRCRGTPTKNAFDHPHGGNHLGDVVHPYDPCALKNAYGEGRDRPLYALMLRAVEGFADEILVRYGDECGIADSRDFWQPAGQFE